jgi:hypothetical protein
MQDEKTVLSFADFNTSSPKRPDTALLINDGSDNEIAPNLTGRGRSLYVEHETVSAGAYYFAAGARIMLLCRPWR